MSYDITLCPGQGCPVKENCFRFTAEVLGRQDFFGRLPYNFDTRSCEYFISNRPSEEQIRQRAFQIWQQAGCPDGKAVDCWVMAERELVKR